MHQTKRRVEFQIDDLAWFDIMWPEDADFRIEPPFRCTYALREDERGEQYYELLTDDGRTNFNDLNGFEKSCLYGCLDYFNGNVQLVGCPDFCIAMTSSDGQSFSYDAAKRDRPE